ncbi:hypothetical protein CRP01_16685 [Flavilitoribacter nigricans DSM 23189 = NBRC 102662]|uniref:Uncharacterized protein n=1 Tax=Flavilitoribacter nigricans (strain ATCC 23147 / DSM 23189 / NBRC 102662 / NCIMB 1420 / SS-2) TaxID=1122177 RepID=A0A2D0NCX5_FLAN2|nr:hypothetical protein CRP01_16685 [Flavilitoribacter nigricans DSM 23189 = NBRC 102662]
MHPADYPIKGRNASIQKAFLPYSNGKNTEIPQIYQGEAAIFLPLHIGYSLHVWYFGWGCTLEMTRSEDDC